MSDPHYDEKLPELYEELREGNVPGFESAYDLIKKTPRFFEEAGTAHPVALLPRRRVHQQHWSLPVAHYLLCDVAEDPPA
jgi:hypothetical protein